MYFENYYSIKEAIDREKQIKGDSRANKENLINSIHIGQIYLMNFRSWQYVFVSDRIEIKISRHQYYSVRSALQFDRQIVSFLAMTYLHQILRYTDNYHDTCPL